MNPDGTNPVTNTGAGAPMGGAGSVVPPALDFTSSNSANLSMADSLASAADNLTSAGMAAKEPDTGSIDMGQIGASDPSATMERPDEPLVPAAPVPGSIGSVTSGPAMATTDTTNVGFGGSTAYGAASSMNGYGNAGYGATSNASSMPSADSMASTAGFGAMPTVNNMNAGAPTVTGGVAGGMDTASTVPGVTPAGAGAAPAMAPSEPYNPFAAHSGSNSASGTSAAGATSMGNAAVPGFGKTSSTNVPAGSQPVTEKFSGKKEAKKPALLTIILGILAVVSLIMAIVFAVLWQQAENNKPISYEPTPGGNVSGGSNDQTLAMMTCTKDLGIEDNGGLEGLTGHNEVITANFVNDQLASLLLSNRYTFSDSAAAGAARPKFEEITAWYGGVAQNLGVESVVAALEINDALATYNVTVKPEQLVGDYIGVAGLSAKEDGSVDLSLDAVKGVYEANGRVCSID